MRVEHPQMRRPFELKVTIVEGHLIILLANPLANLRWRKDKLGAHRQGRYLHLAGASSNRTSG